ncbi:adenylate cyclase [Histophilus somni]|uniref:Inorganic triphosphatase n=1 Tax=Histophilus somni TaxID=731 RepID=A0A9Q7E5U0_HISSO|nr:inorganic triphosphatase [Histophilus somni]ARU64554.1 adenylate cyclase [Histophilus somni]ARU66340.1 adenylate cyclase [Histophilus somni]ARU68215.1 adenylate cyclase [Histophilus somni]ARU70095.1 adenylate cyclase [Histophilus somni]ARU71969.1 adenylate cyclase [Histophilus somni]
MTKEIELKLSVSNAFAQFLSQEMASFHVLKQEKVFLGNTYYDTADSYFARHKMGLRVRQYNSDFTLTLKTNGDVLGGLHSRPEYNVSQESAVPNLAKLTEIYDLPNWHEFVLQPIFRTDFERCLWLVECGYDVEIEVALDQGWIIAGEKSVPICEVEFELKQGKTEDLLNFVANLSLESDVRLSSASKAQRGYQLAFNIQPQIQDWIAKWREFIVLATHEKIAYLVKFEQQLIEESVMLGKDYFAQEFLRTVERIGAFFNLYHFYSENVTLLENQVNLQLTQGITHLDQNLLADLVERNAYLLLQIKDIIRRHSENKNNALAIEKLFALFHSGQYVKRMLDLTFLTL